MTKITPEDVRKVAKLARLELPENEIEEYTDQLEKILGYVAQLEQIETGGIEPTTRAVEVSNVVREDIVQPTEIREEILNQIPNKEGDYIRVPKII